MMILIILVMITAATSGIKMILILWWRWHWWNWRWTYKQFWYDNANGNSVTMTMTLPMLIPMTLTMAMTLYAVENIQEEGLLQNSSRRVKVGAALCSKICHNSNHLLKIASQLQTWWSWWCSPSVLWKWSYEKFQHGQFVSCKQDFRLHWRQQGLNLNTYQYEYIEQGVSEYIQTLLLLF